MLCGGATKPRDLPVEGRELKGIHFAVDFLRADTRSLLGGDHELKEWISARHKEVVVIGGGDTGTDCVGTALRHGCANLVQFEILPKPPEQRQADNPWPEWPRTFRIDYGQEEARDLLGRDPREFGITTKRFVGDSNGHVKEVHTVRVQWEAVNGRMTPKEIAGSEQVWPAQSGAAGDGIPRSRGHTAAAIRRWSRISAATSKQSTVNSPPVSPASSPPATCAVGRAWSSGRSRKVAAPPESVIAT